MHLKSSLAEGTCSETTCSRSARSPLAAVSRPRRSASTRPRGSSRRPAPPSGQRRFAAAHAAPARVRARRPAGGPVARRRRDLAAHPAGRSRADEGGVGTRSPEPGGGASTIASSTSSACATISPAASAAGACRSHRAACTTPTTRRARPAPGPRFLLGEEPDQFSTARCSGDRSVSRASRRRRRRPHVASLAPPASDPAGVVVGRAAGDLEAVVELHLDDAAVIERPDLVGGAAVARPRSRRPCPLRCGRARPRWRARDRRPRGDGRRCRSPRSRVAAAPAITRAAAPSATRIFVFVRMMLLLVLDAWPPTPILPQPVLTPR